MSGHAIGLGRYHDRGPATVDLHRAARIQPVVRYSIPGEVIIPYGLADHATAFATVPLAEVLAAMEPA